MSAEVTEILPCLVCGHAMRADALQAGLDDVQSISREVERLDVAAWLRAWAYEDDALSARDRELLLEAAGDIEAGEHHLAKDAEVSS